MLYHAQILSGIQIKQFFFIKEKPSQTGIGTQDRLKNF